ncbi:MBOAT, membrane-bound O-acyltransferase family-domain-containing protein [Halteromyces radiatus]|uniref:MBOAT, membrane-bound O-acyltransferase family-domain-containing protein n=1 Tax=Halteromyces radiatus TaxID=101107 RepID=UPI0022209AE2|nr:MBOAT, membrane-bound O-acyltransferase family-domain-containing protein [Halteromyces radiatus]KAI8099740.1 MBOAT, membrane-bound O-acyltransferase family-domain-containing protein [Halteromyces radiatus]
MIIIRIDSFFLFFIFFFFFLICSHLDRQFSGIKGDSKLDYSGALMVVIMKLSAFGFNVIDGRTKDKSTISPFHLRMQIDPQDYPSLITFFGWMLFFGGVLAGPACDYMDYIRLLTLPLNETSPSPLTEKQRNIRLSCIKPVSIVFLKVFFMIMGLIFIHPTYNYEALLTSDYLNMPFVHRFIFVQIVGPLTRFRFYTVWMLAEGACMVVGLGFNGFDEKDHPRWDRVVNANLNTDWAPCFKVLVERWNSGGNRWLKHYVYMRVVSPPGSKQKPVVPPMLLTYVISSIWHGFHPGYYVYFLSVAMIQHVAGLMRRIVRPLLLSPDMKHGLPVIKPIYDVIGIFLTVSSINIMSASFMLLTTDKYMVAFHSVYYYSYIFTIVGGIICYTVKGPLIRLQKRRLAKYHQQQKEKNTVNDLAVGNIVNNHPSSLKTE